MRVVVFFGGWVIKYKVVQTDLWQGLKFQFGYLSCKIRLGPLYINRKFNAVKFCPASSLYVPVCSILEQILVHIWKYYQNIWKFMLAYEIPFRKVWVSNYEVDWFADVPCSSWEVWNSHFYVVQILYFNYILF